MQSYSGAAGLRGLLACKYRFASAFALCALAASAAAAQFELVTPANSQAFGTAVATLPNGNIVVTDPYWNTSFGAVYLYDSSGNLISTLSGSAGDYVGLGGIVVLANGNFVVSSPDWAGTKGAATWIDGTAGLNATVSAANSLVGASADDHVSSNGIIALSNGNYVVASPHVDTPAMDGGAVTWCSGTTGKTNDNQGIVSAVNSLIGATQNDLVGLFAIVALNNGNYVVVSNASVGEMYSIGAVTWNNGADGHTSDATTAVSASNSLVGAADADQVGGGGVTALNNGNYVVSSPSMSIGGKSSAGAATWVDGISGQTLDLTHVPSTANSLVGSAVNDKVGSHGVTALANGNYAVASPNWSGDRGAASWGNGAAGTSGLVSATNSLVGATAGDQIGSTVTALSNGNYVVASFNASIGATNTGAATWVNGTNGATKNSVNAVSAANSLIGQASDFVGQFGVTALKNGNYVVISANASVGASQTGAVTFGDGSSGTVGLLSAANSLIGAAFDGVGYGGVTALSNGNYVVDSFLASAGASGNAGAATWVNGSTGQTSDAVNVVSAANSIVGAAAGDQVGWGNGGTRGVLALSNGNYVVMSPRASFGAQWTGAVTFGNGLTGFAGTLSPQNSIVGSLANDAVGQAYSGLSAFSFSDGNYAVISGSWNGIATGAGAVTLGSGTFRTKGPLAPYDSVLAGAENGGSGLVLSYDATRHQLVVGRPAENLVSLFTPDQVFADGNDG
jgi:hypothetical protein